MPVGQPPLRAPSMRMPSVDSRARIAAAPSPPTMMSAP
jgi:hypothetical protein